MNYLAHLFLAQPTADSHMGNLLGDFRKGADISQYNQQILRGLDNHYLVDKFTDQHATTKAMKQLFKPQYRRFSGIAIDVMYDHFLIQHWTAFHAESFERFKAQSYVKLRERQSIMPPRMHTVIGKITQDDWFEHYREADSVYVAIGNIARRIRFKNDFERSVEDIDLHYEKLEQSFLEFFPQLVNHVNQTALEHK